MSNQNKKMRVLKPTFGLIIGGAVGLIVAILANWNIAIALIIGAGLGLVIGAAVYSFSK